MGSEKAEMREKKDEEANDLIFSRCVNILKQKIIEVALLHLKFQLTALFFFCLNYLWRSQRTS